MFDKSPCSTEKKLANFPKYVRRQTLARFLVQTELFKLQMPIKGSILECGVHHGGGLMAWAKLSSIFEPYNYHRKILGFDTFAGFPSVSKVDQSEPGKFKENYDVYNELKGCIADYDDNRFLNHKEKVEIIKGDAVKTLPKYVKDHPHLLVSMLYLDFDIYKPTVKALETILPRMPKGAIIGFDELHNPDWPGETQALLDTIGIRHEIRCFDYEPNISYLIMQ